MLEQTNAPGFDGFSPLTLSGPSTPSTALLLKCCVSWLLACHFGCRAGAPCVMTGWL